ncbi:SPOR domain-containing protein [Saccharophagus degradans]|uniref:Sporulation related n=1 Tax=Saccharophagus degradans (strain 2-40 / ATCC 43961 / DSM 17024) TaxID=203122 RepID=Q21H85_SACD2|nr:AAA family ATPase [Saccharophagus degradans]ABD81944.1 Sporulation related [Saccharophagus degradans 2-40]
MDQEDIFASTERSGDGLPYYYSTPARNGLLQQVIHFIRFGEGLPIVQGRSGAGKSTLSLQLVSLLQPEANVVQISAAAFSEDFTSLLAEVAGDFGLPVEGGASSGELLVALRHFTRALADDKRLGVLVVDDAQELDDQSLGGLISLLQGQQIGGSGFHLVLFASEDFVSRVDALGLLDVPVYDFDVPSFSPTELSGFLRGVSGREISSEGVQSLWNASKGVPGVALSLLNAQSQHGLDEEVEAGRAGGFAGGLPVAHLVAFSVLLGVLIWVFFAGDDGDQKAESSTSQRVEKSIPLPPVEVKEAVAKEPKVEPERSEGERVVLDTLPEGVVESVENDVAPVDEVSVSSAPSEIVQKEVISGGDQPAAKVVNEPKPTAPQKAPVPQVSGDERVIEEHERYLLAQNGDAYTLQVLAASKKEALLQFVRRQPNSANLRIYQGIREGRQLYVVIIGVYSSKEEALSAIADLPLTQRQSGPWPRQLKTIQADIRENRRK